MKELFIFGNVRHNFHNCPGGVEQTSLEKKFDQEKKEK